MSHVAKCLAIRELLIDRDKGHEVLVAVTQKHSQFLLETDVDHNVLTDIQEIDGAASPTTTWFKEPQRIIDCIYAELALLKEYKPDSVLGIFRFTSKASAQLAGIHYDSLICGCMLPNSPEVLGFGKGDAGIDLQRENINGFYQYAGAKLSLALTSLGLDRISDIRQMLKGNRTFLWDFPEFLSIERDKNVIHVGPIFWNDWAYNSVDNPELPKSENPLAVITFGTCTMSAAVVERIKNLLLDIGYDVLIAAGGQADLLGIMPKEPRVIISNFVPLHKILPQTNLLICHGGQMTVFDALYHQIPVVVMPFQPEQAHNGVCLERLGCGCRLIPPQPFRQNPWIYTDALNRMTDREIKSKIHDLINNPKTARQLAQVKQLMMRYKGVDTIAKLLEEA